MTYFTKNRHLFFSCCFFVYMHILLAFLLSEAKYNPAVPLSNHQHTIKWLPTLFLPNPHSLLLTASYLADPRIGLRRLSRLRPAQVFVQLRPQSPASFLGSFALLVGWVHVPPLTPLHLGGTGARIGTSDQSREMGPAALVFHAIAK